ncbi:hypothetical protein CF319_g2028 [Tilletia indica]|nr:hypothetical protein CF319_g2028 [Tilletia indica]
MFEALEPLDDTGSPLVVQIAHLLYGRPFWLSIAAQDLQSSSAAPGLHKRCIVSALTADQWECGASSCPRGRLTSTACVHRKHGAQFVRDLHGENAFEPQDEMGFNDLAELQHRPELVIQRQAVSHVVIAPPKFALLPRESSAAIALEAAEIPSLLSLDAASRCYACGLANAQEVSIEEREVRVYLALRVVRRRIEVKRCMCRSKRRGERRTFGPDLGALGLFNLNNEIVISHALLNAYSSQMLRSSTPLTAFHASSNDLYLEHGSHEPFLPKTTFLRAFYLFIELQHLPNSFSCPECGAHPDVVIADGVVLAHTLTDDHSLVPPTTPSSDINLHPQPGRIRPFLPLKSLRASVRDLAAKLNEPGARVR